MLSGVWVHVVGLQIRPLSYSTASALLPDPQTVLHRLSQSLLAAQVSGNRTVLSQLSPSVQTVFLASTVSLGSFEKQEKRILQPQVVSSKQRGTPDNTCGWSHGWRGSPREVTEQMACGVIVN